MASPSRLTAPVLLVALVLVGCATQHAQVQQERVNQNPDPEEVCVDAEVGNSDDDFGDVETCLVRNYEKGGIDVDVTIKSKRDDVESDEFMVVFDHEGEPFHSRVMPTKVARAMGSEDPTYYFYLKWHVEEFEQWQPGVYTIRYYYNQASTFERISDATGVLKGEALGEVIKEIRGNADAYGGSTITVGEPGTAE